MKLKRFSNIIAFDDAPFISEPGSCVKIVGSVFADLRFDGVLIGEIEKDGTDAAEKIVKLLTGSKFAEHAQLIMIQGIALGGFNVVDVFFLNQQLGLPILVVARKVPDMDSIRKALISHIAGGKEKWAIIEKLGPMESVENVYVQRVGLSLSQATNVVKRFAIHSHIPEPIRVAHLIAGTIANGQSRGCP